MALTPLTRSVGTIAWKATYSAFGNTTIDPTSSITNNLRFPGQYYDAETNLHYNWNRYYDPKTGRYLTPDPIGLDVGMNLFVYVGNDPVNGIDPEGLWVQTLPPLERILTAIITAGIAYYGTKGAMDAIKEKTKDDKCGDEDKPCNPPEGTLCHGEIDYGKPHGGLSPHYHIYQMQKKRPSGMCYWRYLGGKVGAGVLPAPLPGMAPCSSYPNFVGRSGK